MSKRRQVGDFVLVTYRRGADAYLCQIDQGDTSPCINHELFKVGKIVYLNDGKTLGCQDTECKEWPTLNVIEAYGTDRQHYNKKDHLYHVCECQMGDVTE